jgi:hypothetical protein
MTSVARDIARFDKSTVSAVVDTFTVTLLMSVVFSAVVSAIAFAEAPFNSKAIESVIDEVDASFASTVPELVAAAVMRTFSLPVNLSNVSVL